LLTDLLIATESPLNMLKFKGEVMASTTDCNHEEDWARRLRIRAPERGPSMEVAVREIPRNATIMPAAVAQHPEEPSVVF